jgi:hypothetical protein
LHPEDAGSADHDGFEGKFGIALTALAHPSIELFLENIKPLLSTVEYWLMDG